MTGNVVDVAPCGTVMVEGTVATAGDALSEMVAPPLRAADVRATVQVDPADGVTDIGLHEKPFNFGVWTIVTLPPLVEVEIFVPTASTAMPLVSWTDEDVSGVEPERVKAAVATMSFEIAVVLRPHSMQVAVPTPLVHESDLFASAGPGAKLADEKSAVE